MTLVPVPAAQAEPGRRHGRAGGFLFHPFELALCGQKGTGRTRLVEALLPLLEPLRVGYAKKDVHGFQFDHPGRDTWRAADAGAAVAWIEHAQASAHQQIQAPTPTLRAELFAACDLVLAEGWRHEPLLPKLLFVDGLDPEPELPAVAACVTADADLARRGAEALPPWLRHPARPLFHSGETAELAGWIREFFLSRLAARPLRGLVLAGGHSTRMGRDKALIDVAGQPQAMRAARLLEPFCRDVSLSVRPDQAGERAALGLPLVLDRHLDLGPAGALLSALELDPDAAWLVLGCDMPLVTPRLLEELVRARNPWRVATAFDSARDQLPEPLCAIWEPRARQRLLAHLGLGQPCPRRVLLNSATQRLASPPGDELLNMNRPDDLEQVLRCQN